MGEMKNILKLKDEELIISVGKTIFGKKKSTEDIKKEFQLFEKHIVKAISNEGEETSAIILITHKVLDPRYQNKQDMIVIAEKGSVIPDCGEYFSFIARSDAQSYNFLNEAGITTTAELFCADGYKFLDRHQNSVTVSAEIKNFSIDYELDSPLVLERQGALLETTQKRVPSTLKFGFGGQNHFMELGVMWGESWQAQRRISLACIPARNIDISSVVSK